MRIRRLRKRLALPLPKAGCSHQKLLTVVQGRRDRGFASPASLLFLWARFKKLPRTGQAPATTIRWKMSSTAISGALHRPVWTGET